MNARYWLEAYASAPLRYTSPQVKVLHCLTVKGQECSVARYLRKFSHVNYDGSFGAESRF